MTTIATKYPFVGSIETKQGGRNENQDNAGFVDTPIGLLLVVCDGMGGGPGGRTASLMAVDTILNVLSDVSEHTDRKDALKFAIEKANDIIYSKAKETPELRGMGTTVAAVLINENSAVIAHSGDTRVYQLRKGTIAYRSADHSVVANLVRQKKITEEEARNHPQSNIVTRALGIRPNIEIEFDEVTFHRGDRFVLCTDGIWGMMPQRDLVKSLSRVMGISELTALMTEEIDKIGKENGGGHDNMTLAIIDTSFDSALKKIDNKRAKDGVYVPNTKKVRYVNLIKIILAFIAFCIIAAIFLFVYLSNSQEGNNQNPLRGETTTTVGDGNSVIVCPDSNDVNQIVVYDKENDKSPFSNDNNGIKNREIASQIKQVVSNLDSLKKIKGAKKDEAVDKKRKFVNGVIVPNVEILKGKVASRKKKDIDNILEMLKDNKTVQCSIIGQTTAESVKHIKEIKNKVEGLQN